jgi:hypothetical protein
VVWGVWQCHERVPSILKTLSAIGVVDAASVAIARQLQRRADDEMPRMQQALEALLPEIDLMLIRVTSCFEDV